MKIDPNKLLEWNARSILLEHYDKTKPIEQLMAELYKLEDEIFTSKKVKAEIKKYRNENWW